MTTSITNIMQYVPMTLLINPTYQINPTYWIRPTYQISPTYQIDPTFQFPFGLAPPFYFELDICSSSYFCKQSALCAVLKILILSLECCIASGFKTIV